ncbi:MAG: PEP-CTERM sorting domain-containing protein [Planctomycetota bacterium]
MYLRLCVQLSLFIGFLSVASAGVILDQEYDAFAEGGTSGFAINPSQQVAQSFTVGVGGTLQQVDLQVIGIAPLSDLILDIFEVDAGSIGASLGSLAVPPSTIHTSFIQAGRFASVDVSSFNIEVNPGDVLALGLSLAPSATSGAYAWNGFGGYAGGRTFFKDGFVTDFTATGQDSGFRTYINTATANVVPEPSSVVIFACGIGCLFRRRTR